MSRVSKWKFEKTKVKVVFRLQFHATHVPLTGWDKLFISFIPADSGKATAKTTKANVRNGTCKWADPIYETTRLLQDSKSKQYDEKLYKVVMAMGSSRAGTLGEATINLADYIDGSKPSALTLPLHGCNFGTILHVTIQLLTAKTGFREFEQQRELRENGIQAEAASHGPANISPYEDAADDQANKASSRIKYTADANEPPSHEKEVNSNEEYADSATSGSFSADKHETSSPHEIDSLRSTMSGDLSMLSHSQSPHAVKEEDRFLGSNELTMAFEENSRLKGSLELAESSLFNLNLEVSSLQTIANELGSETQRLSQQLASEISTSKELANEVSVMKSECLKFKDDIIRLQDLKSDPQIDHMVGVVESKIREVQSKTYTYLVPHDIDANSVYSEFEALLDFLQDFKLRNDRIAASGNELGLDLCQPENILVNLSMVPSVSEADNQKSIDLVRELDDSKIEKEALNRKADQMECYYEALIHELEENQKRLLGELHHMREEHSSSLYTLSLSKSETESVCRDMNQKMLKSVEEKRELEALNKELKTRATTSEAALRRARLNYSIAVEKLQKDLQVLSSQVVSMFETNENLIKQVLPESQNQRLGGGVLLEDLKRSLCFQEENYQKVEKELTEMCLVNLNLDIYSRIMQESLREGDAEIKIMKGKMGGLLEELELSRDSQNRLMIRLEKTTDDIRTLSEYKSSTISQCSDMAFKNQLLEDKLASACEENCLLAQKVKDMESKYRACLARLKQDGLENEKVMNEMSLLREQLMTLKVESDELVSSKENAILQLEEMQHNARKEYSELLDENRSLKSERAVADESLGSLRSEIQTMKQKFRSSLEDNATKLDLSSALVDKLQTELESVANKLHMSSEAEKKFTQVNKVLLADLALLEDQMHELSCKNGHLAREVLSLDALAEELEMNGLTISKLMHDKEELAVCLQEKTEESMKLSSEVSYLKETSKIMHDEKAYKDDLEGKVRDLTLCLNKGRDKQCDLEQQNAKLLSSLASLRSDFEASEAQNKLLSYSKNEIMNQLEECRRKMMMMEANFSLEISVSKQELEISVLVLISKIHELSHKLSKQVLKAEKYKNLSTHFEELKGKAEAECLVARGKRETELIRQDSLRIAFIKEQCETQVQELKQQVSISKKHGEEMLLRLQDAIDEIENMKKSEAVSMKKKEELLLRISALETEKREKSNAYDRTKAELECALLSLECCREEKEKLGKSLMELEEEKSRLAVELNSVKGRLEDLKCSIRDGESILQDGAGTELHVMDEFTPSDDNNLDVENNHSGAERLRSSMEHLHEELEKMKNENKVFNTTSHDDDPGFQSSFLKPDSDDEAIFKSFKDINELIQEMLEVKERHSSLEAELAEMHDRYSQLSLEFAEVEGERQKLKMMLKNVRPSRNLVTGNRSPDSGES